MTNFGALIVGLPEGEGQEFVLSKAAVSVGRAATSDIALQDAKVSRSHARVDCGEEGCYLVDLDSANGTLLNGIAVGRARLSSGDVIRIGLTTLRYEAMPELSGEDLTHVMTRIDSAEELDANLAGDAVPAQLNESAIPRLAVHTREKTWEIPLEGEGLTMGRLAGNDVVIDSPLASRNHARIERLRSGFVLRDLKSQNGTWVGGKRVTAHPLADGDTVRIADARMTFKAGFVEEDLTLIDVPRARGAAKRPIVVIPGFMGSNLWLGSEKVWPNVRQFFQRPERMKYMEGETALVAKGLVDEVVIVPNVIKQQQYGGLIAYLEETLGYERGRDLLEFAYDFRQDLRISARQLAQAIADWNQREPVTVIAHSMGSLVSRYYVDRLDGERRVGRLISLGGPHLGSPKAIVNLAINPAVLPFGLLGGRVRDVLLTYPSMYCLLPNYSCGTDQHGQPVDWLHDPSWLPAQYAPLLKAAADFRAELRDQCRIPTVCVFGYGLKTLTDLRVQRDSEGLCTKADLVQEPSGDSTVPEFSATLEGAEIHPVRQYHGTLHIDADVKKRLKMELIR